MAQKPQRVRITTYIRNAGRSLGYAVGDVVGEYAPTMKSIVDDSKQLHDEVKMSSGDLKNSIRDMINEYKTGVVANTLDDLKTGNWYNKKREEDALNDMFGGGFDFDDDWGDFDDSFDDDDISDSSDDTRDTKAIINSIDAVGENISKNVAYSNARSAEYIVSNQKASTRAMYELTGKGFNQVSNILLSMNDTMVGLATIGQPLSQHIQNSGVFYTQTTETLNSMNQSLTKLVERTAFMDSMNKQNSRNGKRNKMSDIFSGGEFSLSSYIDMVKENTKDQLEMFKSLKDMLEMMGGKGGKNASFASELPKFIINTAMPNFFKATLKQFNDTLNNALTSTMVRGGKALRGSNNFFLNMLGEIFFPELKMKKSIDSSKYNRGPMQWDGEAKRALTRVIPDYLAKIYGILSGDQRYYDYEKGTYKTMGQINQEREDLFQSQAKSAGREFKAAAMKRVGAKDKEKVGAELDQLIFNSIMDGSFNFDDLRAIVNRKNYKEIQKKLGLSNEAMNAIFGVVNASRDRSFGNKYRNIMSDFESNVYRAQSYISDKMYSAEENGSILGLLSNENFLNGGQIVITGGSRKGGKNQITIARADVKDYTEPKKNYNIQKVGDSKYKVGGRTYTLSDKEFEDFKEELDKFDSDAAKEEFLKSKDGKELAKTAKGSFKKLFGSDKDLKEAIGDKRGVKRLLATAKYYWQKPFYAISYAIDNLGRGINELFWGPNGDDGIIAKITNKLKDTWGNMQDKIKSFWDKIFPEVDENGNPVQKQSLKEAIGAEARGLWAGIKGRVAGVGDRYRSARNAAERFDMQYAEMVQSGKLQEFGEAGTGSGLIHKIPTHRLSSGFKHGKHFKSTMFSGGESGLIHLDDNIALDPNTMKHYRIIKDADGNTEYKEIDLSKSKNPFRRAQLAKQIKDAHATNVKNVTGEMKDNIKNSKVVGGIAEGGKILGHGIMEAASRIIYGDKDVEEQKKTVMDNLSKTMKDLAPAKGAIGLGAIGGAGVSLLTGALIGPIAGAAIGAGIGLATKSEHFQNFLFGEGDPESDDYKKGLLGGLGKALKADGFEGAKKTGIGAILGGTAGMVLGSPLVGAILGSSAGYIASSEKAQKFLFGDEDRKNALGEVKDKIKERFPNMAAGAIAGLVAGPFGIAGNLVVGAGLGYVSASEKFKTFMFGEEEKDENGKGTGKRHGGLVGTIHDKIMNPLDEIMHNTANMIKGGLKSVFKKMSDVFARMGMAIGRRLNGFIERHPVLKEFANKVKGTISKFNPLKLIPMAVGGLRNATARHNIRKGYGVYDAKLGRNLYAEELQARAEELGMFGPRATNTTNAAKLISAAQSPEELDEIISAANDIQNRKINRERDYFDAIESKDLTKRLEAINLNPRQIKEYRNALYNAKKRGGKIDDFTSRFDDATKEKLNNISYDLEQSLNKSDNELAETNVLMKKLKAAGIKVDAGFGNIDAGTFADMARNEKKRFENEEKTADNTTATNKNVDEIKEKVADIVEILKRIDKNDSGLSGEGSGLFRRLAGGASNGEMRTEFDAFGNPHQYKKNNQGEWTEDESDKETKRSRSVMDKFSKSLESLPLIGGALAGFKKLGGLFESGEEKGKKKGILQTISDWLDPENPNSLSGSLISFLSTGKAKVLSAITKVGAGAATFAGLGALTLAIGGLSGKLNGLVNNIVKTFDKDDNKTSEGRMNSGSKTATLADGSTAQLQVDPTTGEAVTDANGNYIDKKGNTISPNQVNSISSTQNRSFKHGLIKNAAVRTAQTAFSKKGVRVTGTAASLVKGGAKAIGWAAEHGNVVAKIAKNAGKRGANLAKGVGGASAKVLNVIKSVLELIFRKFAPKAMGQVDIITSRIASALAAKGGAKSLGKGLAKIAGKAFIAADMAVTATNAWGDAENILGIVEEASTGEKLVATIIACLNELVGGLIPHDIMASIIIGALERVPFFADNIAPLRQKQSYAKQVVDKYNSQNGTAYTVEEYNLNANDNVKSGWWTSAKHGVKSWWDTRKNNKKKTASAAGSRLISKFDNSLAGGASGFVSQFDPKYQGYQVSGTNFAGKGCGPAVASMTASALGKSLSVGSAVSASKNYQVDNGVTLDYFANTLGSQGIDTEYIAGGGAGDLYNSIASGKKVILLGQDRENTSKANSPFGPNNHYVVATGLDRSGNVVVNDPELNGPTTYSPGILNSVKYGVAAGRSGLRRRPKHSKKFRMLAGGGNPRDDATTRSIWTYLRQNLGMSEAAAAGIMGNMEGESGCNPDRHQKKGSAYGLCQWDGGRKKALMNRANYKNLNVQLAYLASELPQKSIVYWGKSGVVVDYKTHKKFKYEKMSLDQFKRLTDVATATVKFEAAFERAGKPNIEERINWARAYYEMFTGKTYEVPEDSAMADEMTDEPTSAEAEDDGLFKNMFNFASDFGTLFSNSMGKLFTREDETVESADTDNVGDTNGQSYNVATSKSGSKIVDLMKSKIGTLQYSMKGPRDPEKGSSDCSSTVRWAVKKASGVDIGGSTPDQYKSKNLSTVWYGNGKYASNIPENAKPGDILFFARPNSNYTKGRADRVGHVGIYEGNGMMIDHGGGKDGKLKGPTEKSVPVGSKGQLIKISRVNTEAAGYSGLASIAGGSAGILINSRAGSRNGLASVVDPSTGRLVPYSRFAGGATNLADASRNMLNELSSNVANNKKGNGISPELVAQLLSAITNILNNIADNTAPVSKIYQALVAYLEAGGSSGTDTVNIHKAPKKAAVNQSSSSDEIDPNVKALVTTLAELAKG